MASKPSFEVKITADTNDVDEGEVNAGECDVTYTSISSSFDAIQEKTIILNDDKAGATLVWDDLETPVLSFSFDEGKSTEYSIVLKSQPSVMIALDTNVEVGTLKSRSQTEFAVTPLLIQFDSTNWNIPVTEDSR